MPTHIYGNLAPMGWTELKGEDGTTIDGQDPYTWWKEGGNIEGNHTFKKLQDIPYANVNYQDKNYRLFPEHFQIVTGD